MIPVLLEGHSFVVRLDRFWRRSGAASRPPAWMSFTCRASGGGRIGTVMNRIRRASLQSYKIILLDIGSNDLDEDYVDVEEVVKNMLALVNYIRQAAPLVAIIVMPSLHRANCRSPTLTPFTYNRRVDLFNQALQEELACVGNVLNMAAP